MAYNLRIATLCGLTLLFCALRIAGDQADVFKDLAHLFVGALWGGFFLSFGFDAPLGPTDKAQRAEWAILAGLLSVVELFAFLASWFHPHPH